MKRFFSSFTIILCAILLPNISLSQNAINSQNNAKFGFSNLAKKLMPAVVGINTINEKMGGSSKRFKGQGGIIATGSGFIFNNGRHVITNNHVVEMGEAYEISLNNGEILKAKLLGRDEETDIAVLEILSPRTLPYVVFGNSDLAQIGDWAIAIGRPFGLGNSFSVGVISGNNRDLHSGRFDNYIQTDAAINQGNSGGPLFNENGEVIGVNTAIISNSQSGASVGIGFAIPSNLVRKIANDIIKNGFVIRGYVGFRARLSAPNELNGVYISAIANNGPAQKSGLKIGDRITHAAGTQIVDPRQLARIISNSAIGTKMRLDGYRGTKKIYTIIDILRPPSVEGQSQTGAPAMVKVQGISIRVLNSQEKLKYKTENALIISSVDEYSNSASIFKAGDIILEIAGQEVQTPQEAKALIDKKTMAKTFIMVKIMRGQNVQYKMLR